MRKISNVQILVFLLLILPALYLSVISIEIIFTLIPPNDFRGIILFILGIIFFYIYTLIIYRLFMSFFPFKEGEIQESTREEFSYHVYLLFYLILFYPIMRGGFVPVPLMRLFYQALGARLGNNTYSSGILLDPPFIQIGADTLVGQYALLVPHAIENKKLAHYPIQIGNNVTIGAHSVILAGVTIGDGALVATGAIVTKGTNISAGEIWGGVPARCLKKQKI